MIINIEKGKEKVRILTGVLDHETNQHGTKIYLIVLSSNPSNCVSFIKGITRLRIMSSRELWWVDCHMELIRNE